jgi:hypothetical protein
VKHSRIQPMKPLRLAVCTTALMALHASTNAPMPQSATANERPELTAETMDTWLLEGCQGFDTPIDSERCDELERQFIALQQTAETSAPQEPQPFVNTQPANTEPFQQASAPAAKGNLWPIVGLAAFLAIGATVYIKFIAKK